MKELISRICVLILVVGVTKTQANPRKYSIDGKSFNVWEDNKGMPRCVQKSKEHWSGFIIDWEPSHQYSRNIRIIDLENPLLQRQAREQFNIHCSNWKEILFYKDQFPSEIITSIEQLIETMRTPLDSKIKYSIELILRGFNQYIESSDPESYLVNQPIEEFTEEINMELSSKYGLAFTTEVYRELRESRPLNKIYRQKVANRFNTTFTPFRLDKVKKTKVIIAKGYMEPPKSGRIDTLLNATNSFISQYPEHFIDVSFFDVLTTDPAHINATKIRMQIESELRKGNNLILVGASKGAFELFLSLIEINKLNPEILFPDSTQNLGQIYGVLSLSGSFGGSFIVDWATQFPVYPISYVMLHQEAKENGILSEQLGAGLISQSTSYAKTRFIDQANNLPRHLLYFEVSGLPKDYINGMSNFEQEVKDTVLDTFMFPVHGTHDGLIQFPGTEIQPSWVTSVYQLTIDGTHSLLNGNFQNQSLSKKENQNRFIQSVLSATLEIIEEN